MYLYLKPIIKIRIFEVLYRDFKKIPLFISNYFLILYLNSYLFAKEYLLQYYLLIYLLSNLSTFENYYLERKIENNQINYIVLKPYSLFINRFIVFFTKNITCFIVAVFEVGIFAYLTKFQVDLSMDRIGICLIFLIIGVAIGFFTSLCLSFTRFWFESTKSIYSLYYLVLGLLSGMFFPLEILNKYSQFIELSPFAYLYYLPTKILLHGNVNILLSIAIGVIWILIFLFLSKFMFNKGLIKYNNSRYE